MDIDGELYLGGKGLAKGYFNQSELTEQKFIDHPFQTLNDNEIKPKLYI